MEKEPELDKYGEETVAEQTVGAACGPGAVFRCYSRALVEAAYLKLFGPDAGRDFAGAVVPVIELPGGDEVFVDIRCEAVAVAEASMGVGPKLSPEFRSRLCQAFDAVADAGLSFEVQVRGNNHA